MIYTTTTEDLTLWALCKQFRALLHNLTGWYFTRFVDITKE